MYWSREDIKTLLERVLIIIKYFFGGQSFHNGPSAPKEKMSILLNVFIFPPKYA